MNIKFENAYVYNTDKRCFEYGSLCFSGGFITKNLLFPDAVIDVAGGYLLPGFIDVHTHGRCGIDIMEANADMLGALSLAYAQTGTTTVYPTIMTAPIEKLEKAIDEIKKADRFADFAGVHIEGPYISVKKPGCHDTSVIRKPSYDEIKELAKRILPLRTHLTIAPEEDEENIIERFTERFAKCGGTVGIGHTNCTAKVAYEAVEKGAVSFTHTFNAMTPINHREPGAAGAALTANAYAEFICDGIHVAPEVISMAYHAKEHQGDKFVLVTDSLSPAGLPDGDYEMNGIRFTLDHGKCATPEGVIVGMYHRTYQSHYLLFTKCVNPEETNPYNYKFIVCDPAAYTMSQGDNIPFEQCYSYVSLGYRYSGITCMLAWNVVES